MKKRQVVLYVVVMLILLTTSVCATINTNLGFKIKTQNSVVRPGDEIEVTVCLEDLETDKEIGVIEGFIDYNKEIFEPLSMDSVIKDEDGKVQLDENNYLKVYEASDDALDTDKGIVLNFNPVKQKDREGDCRLVVNFSTPVNEDTDLVTLKFKVKADVPAGKYETAINYKLFTVYDNEGNERVDLANRGITVNIGNVSENPGNENETENEVTNNETNNETKNETENTAKNEAKEDDSKNETKNNVNNEPATTVVNEDKNSGNNGNGGNKAPTNGAGSQKDESVSPTNLPKTGYRLIIIPIVIIAIVGLVFYKKYSKYNKFDNK